MSKIVDGGRNEHQRRAGQLQGCDVVFGGPAVRLLSGKHCSNRGSPLGNIVVLVRSLFVTFHVVSVDE